MIEVKVIDGSKQNFLIEYVDQEGNKKRVTVPRDSLVKDNGKFLHPDPLKGVPYGVDWGSFPIDVLGLQSALDRELKNNGIFTAKDMQNNLKTAQNILLSLAGLTVNELLKYERDGNTNNG